MKTSCLQTKLVIICTMLVVECPYSRSLAMRGTTGTLEGRVIDHQHGNPLVGVNVVVVGTMLGSVTDTSGYYRINNLRAGTYDVRFSIVGYKTTTAKGVAILPDIRNRFDIELDQSPIEMEAIEIQAQRPLIQKDQAATVYSIGEMKIEQLPISTMQEVLALQPSTTLEGNVRGGRTDEVVYLVDGLPVQDVIAGGSGSNIPKNSITGLTIYTGGFEAEYGNALSGVVNIVTKSGTNDHSTVVRIEKDNWLPDSWDTQHNRSTESELTASGPIIRDRLTYFTSNTFLLTDTRWWQDFQNFFSSPISREFNGFGKIEYTPTAQRRISLQGLYSLHSWRDYEFSWRYNLIGLPPEKRNSYRIAATFSDAPTQHTYYTLSLSRFFLLSRIGEESPSDLTLQPYEYDFFLRYIVGGSRNWWADKRQTTTTLKAEFTNEAVSLHLFKLGFEINRFDLSSNLVKYEPQLTYFGKPIANAPLLNYSNTYNYHPWSGSIFVQDKVQFDREGSNASAGLRWDFLDPTAERPIVEFVPTRPNEFDQRITGTTRARFKHQISPRLAIAGPVSETGFVFVNFGQYFQFPLFDYLYSGITPVQLKEGTKNVLTGNPDLEPEKTTMFEVGFKYGVSQNDVASITYFQKNTENQIDTKTLVPFDSKYAGDYGFASYVNNAEAFARGLEFVLSRENDERLSGSISYTYMTTEGVSNYADERANIAQWGFPIEPTTFPLSWDQRHTIKVDVDSRILFGIQASLIVLYNAGRPFTYYPTRDGFRPLDPSYVFVPNNSRMDGNQFVNIKLSKRFVLDDPVHAQMTAYADARNVLDKANVRWVDSNGRIGGELSDPGAYYEPRRVRVGMRLEF